MVRRSARLQGTEAPTMGVGRGILPHITPPEPTQVDHAATPPPTRRRRKRIIVEEDDEGSPQDKENQPVERNTREKRRKSEEKTKGEGKEASTSTSTNPLESSQPTEAPTEQCTICLDDITVRGKLSSCEHLFCFVCISQWASQSNACPLCKQRFTSITKVAPQTPSKRTKRAEKVRVRKRDYKLTESDEEWYYFDDIAQAAAEAEEYDEEDEEDDDDFIDDGESEQGWWGQDFEPGPDFDRRIATRRHPIHVDLDEIEVSDDMDESDAEWAEASEEGSVDGMEDEDLEFIQQIQQAQMLSLMQDQRQQTITDQSISSRRRRKPSFIDLTGMLDDAAESSVSSLSTEETVSEAPARRSSTTRSRRRQVNLGSEPTTNETEQSNPGRRPRRAGGRTRPTPSTRPTSSSSSSSAPVQLNESDDGWLYESVLE